MSDRHAGRAIGSARIGDTVSRREDAEVVAQLASVIGRTFSRLQLQSIYTGSVMELDNALEKLLSSGLVYRRHSADGEGYEFKHALVRDAAYESILRPRRRALHAALFRATEQH